MPRRRAGTRASPPSPSFWDHYEAWLFLCLALFVCLPNFLLLHYTAEVDHATATIIMDGLLGALGAMRDQLVATRAELQQCITHHPDALSNVTLIGI